MLRQSFRMINIFRITVDVAVVDPGFQPVTDFAFHTQIQPGVIHTATVLVPEVAVTVFNHRVCEDRIIHAVVIDAGLITPFIGDIPFVG